MYRYLVSCAIALLLASVGMSQESQEQLAAYYFENGQMDEAAQIYEGLYKEKHQKFYYQRLVASYSAMGRYKDAANVIEKRQKENPKDLTLWVDLGVVYRLQNQSKKSEKCFGRAVDAVGVDQQGIDELCRAFMTVDRPDYAVRVIEAARRATKNSRLYFNEMVEAYQMQGDVKSMVAEYFNLIDNAPSLLQSIQISMQRALTQSSDERLPVAIRRELTQRIHQSPDNKVYMEMMMWFALQQHDFGFAMEQATAIFLRMPDYGGEQIMRVAQIARSNYQYEVAAEGYKSIVARGTTSPLYLDARVGELEMEYELIDKADADGARAKEVQAKYAAALTELGKMDKTIPLMRKYASLLAYHLGDVDSAVGVLDDVLEIEKIKPSVRDEVKLELGDLLLFSGRVWDASLLYMQVDKANRDDVLGSKAKFKNAKLSYYNHDFVWANSQLRALRSSTSKLIANDAMELSLLISDNMEDDSTYEFLEMFADADLLLYRNLLDSAWAGFDAISKRVMSHPILDEVMMRKAQILVGQKRYLEADSVLNMVVEFYPDDILADDALMMRAELNEKQLNQPAVARECYERILIDYPSSLYSDRARSRYNYLKTK